MELTSTTVLWFRNSVSTTIGSAGSLSATGGSLHQKAMEEADPRGGSANGILHKNASLHGRTNDTGFRSGTGKLKAIFFKHPDRLGEMGKGFCTYLMDVLV